MTMNARHINRKRKSIRWFTCPSCLTAALGKDYDERWQDELEEQLGGDEVSTEGTA